LDSGCSLGWLEDWGCDAGWVEWLEAGTVWVEGGGAELFLIGSLQSIGD